MLFGERISDGTLCLQGASRSLTEDAVTYDAVLNLAEKIGVAIIPGIVESNATAPQQIVAPVGRC